MRGTVRCGTCRHAPRWCICAGYRPVNSRVRVDVLMHRHEVWRPTSTGALICRVMPEARAHVYSHDLPLLPASVLRPGHSLWILHPQGEPVPVPEVPETLQALLLDGSWREASRMRKVVEPWGRLVRLDARTEGQSRYRLRAQHAAGMYSSVEALILLLEALGEPLAAEGLRLQFELHVYAGLRCRGAVEEAAAFLEASPLLAAMPGVLGDLQRRRPTPVARSSDVGLDDGLAPAGEPR